jgi:hypothetical protein
VRVAVGPEVAEILEEMGELVGVETVETTVPITLQLEQLTRAVEVGAEVSRITLGKLAVPVW